MAETHEVICRWVYVVGLHNNFYKRLINQRDLVNLPDFEGLDRNYPIRNRQDVLALWQREQTPVERARLKQYIGAHISSDLKGDGTEEMITNMLAGQSWNLLGFHITFRNLFGEQPLRIASLGNLYSRAHLAFLQRLRMGLQGF